jgi:serine/threonine protein kinase
MGCVYAAREIALDREVAIKMLLPGASSDRFLTEARITARLPHPCIPPVHALGLSSDGVPYLVMKLIRGQTLDALLERRTSSAEDLSRFLSIFEQVCQAVGFANAQGVVHRDLKPLNIMVGAFGEVQVMDWGLAKVLGATTTPVEAVESSPAPDWNGNATLAFSTSAFSMGGDSDSNGDTPHESSHTQAGMILGTLGYMAPEQARGEPLDARADVFALGSVLCVLLTGQPAYQGSDDILQRMVRGDVQEAFARLDRSGVDARLIALARRCLAPRPDDRPANAQELAQEVADYRSMVETRLRQAETEAANAQLRQTEQQKRQRLRQVAAGALAITLLLGIIGTSLGLWRANDLASRESEARIEAEQKQILADQARQDEIRAREVAQRERDAKEQQRQYADAVANFLLYDLLAMTTIEGQFRFAANDRLRLSRETTLTELLDRAARKLETRTDLAPRTRAELCRVIGISYHSLGKDRKCIPLLEEGYRILQEQKGPPLETLEMVNSLAVAYRSVRRTDEAIALWEGMLATMSALPPQPKQDGTQTVDLLALVAKSNLAGAYRIAGRIPEALRMFEEVLRTVSAQGKAPTRLTLSTMKNLAATYLVLNKVPQATKMLRQGLEWSQKMLGEPDPYTRSFYPALAEALQAGKQTDEARTLLEQSLPQTIQRLGENHPITLSHIDSLAMVYRTQRQPQKAIDLLEKARRVQLNSDASDHSESVSILNKLGLLYGEVNRHADAIAALRQALTLFEKGEEATPTEGFVFRDNLGHAYLSANQAENAIEVLEALRYDRLHLQGPQHPGLMLTLGNLTASYRRMGNIRQAAATAMQAYTLRKKLQGADHGDTISYLGLCRNLMREACDGERLAAVAPDVVAYYRQRLASNPAELSAQLAALGYDLLRCGRPQEAEKLLRESLTIRKKQLPNDWRTFSTESMLGEALLGQKQLAQAEPLLLSSYQGMIQRLEKIPTGAQERLLEGTERLVRLYQALGKPQEVQRWQTEGWRWSRVLPPPREEL